MCICPPSFAESFLRSLHLGKRQQHWQTPYCQGRVWLPHTNPFLWQTNAAQDVPWATPQPQHRLSTSVVKWIWLPAELQWCAQGTCYSFYKEICPNSQKLSKALEARMCRGWMMLSIHRTAWREVRLLKALFPNLLTLLKINYLSPFTCNSTIIS